MAFLSSLHALSAYSGSTPGLIQKESQSRVGPGATAICFDLWWRQKRQQYWRNGNEKGWEVRRASGARGLVRWSVGHPAVVLCLAGETAFGLSSHLCNHSCVHTHVRTCTHTHAHTLEREANKNNSKTLRLKFSKTFFNFQINIIYNFKCISVWTILKVHYIAFSACPHQNLCCVLNLF